MMKKTLTVSILLILSCFTGTAQYRLDEEVSFIYVKGTSTLHDWTLTVEQMKGLLKGKIENNHIDKIDLAQITIPATALKSGKEPMDQNIYKTLKSDQYPEISYRLKEHVIHNGQITTTGELTIAGITREVETRVTQETVEKHIRIRGEIKFKMTDFNIPPPEFLFGAFTTGDEVLITFYFMFCESLNHQ